MSVPILSPPAIDHDALRAHRLRRLTEVMGEANVDLMVLVNPVTLRYAADWREYALFQAHIPTYYLFVDSDGRTVMHGAYAEDHATIDEFRPASFINVFDGGMDTEATADGFARQVREQVGAGARIAVERLAVGVVHRLRAAGFELVDAEPLVERARYRKSSEELAAMRFSIDVAQAAIAWMYESLRPGMTENELFALLYQTNIANDGSWIDGRMLSSGPRTNPWYQEASDRVIEAGDPVAFDTDMVGPLGYCADISRTWVVGGKPGPVLQDRFGRAVEEITHNASILRAGMTFREFSEAAFRQDDEFVPNRYACVAHGVGMTDEYPKIYYRQDWDAHGYDGLIEPNTVMCIESFVGSVHGGPGVKLEQMWLVTETGSELLSTDPLDRDNIGGVPS